jgi:hypothetical protein
VFTTFKLEFWRIRDRYAITFEYFDTLGTMATSGSLTGASTGPVLADRCPRSGLKVQV